MEKNWNYWNRGDLGSYAVQYAKILGGDPKYILLIDLTANWNLLAKSAGVLIIKLISDLLVIWSIK